MTLPNAAVSVMPRNESFLCTQSKLLAILMHLLSMWYIFILEIFY